MITFFAPASRCLAASARLVNSPVDSITTWTPRSSHGSAAGSVSARTRISSPSTTTASPRASTRPGNRPRIESYLSRWASVLGSVMSLTATNSRSVPASYAARNRLRPIRPKPLIPTLTGICSSCLPFARWAETWVPSLEPSTPRRSPRRLDGGSTPHYRDLDPVAVGVAQVGRVIAGPVLWPDARLAVVLAAGLNPALPCALDGRPPGGGEAHELAPGLHRAARGDEEPWLRDAPPD